MWKKCVFIIRYFEDNEEKIAHSEISSISPHLWQEIWYHQYKGHYKQAYDSSMTFSSTSVWKSVSFQTHTKFLTLWSSSTNNPQMRLNWRITFLKMDRISTKMHKVILMEHCCKKHSEMVHSKQRYSDSSPISHLPSIFIVDSDLPRPIRGPHHFYSPKDTSAASLSAIIEFRFRWF